MESQLDYWGAKALLEWHIELGATEAIADAPINRYDLADKAPKAAKPEAQPAARKPVEVDPVAEAKTAAANARTLDELRAAMQAYEHCDLKLSLIHI